MCFVTSHQDEPWETRAPERRRTDASSQRGVPRSRRWVQPVSCSPSHPPAREVGQSPRSQTSAPKGQDKCLWIRMWALPPTSRQPGQGPGPLESVSSPISWDYWKRLVGVNQCSMRSGTRKVLRPGSDIVRVWGGCSPGSLSANLPLPNTSACR